MTACGSVTVNASPLRRLVSALLQCDGAPADLADHVADNLVEADLRGLHSHGVLRVPNYLEAMAAGRIMPAARATVDQDGPAYAALNGRYGFGSVAAADAMRIAVGKAEAVGVGAVSLYNCFHIGWLGKTVEFATKAGLIALMFVNGGGVGKVVAPSGSVEPALPSAAMAFGFPGQAGPILVDCAAAMTSQGAVWLRQLAGESLPSSWAIDGNGVPSADPHILANGGALTPLGAPESGKGTALLLAIDLLAGLLSPNGPSSKRSGHTKNDVLILTLQRNRFLDDECYATSLERFADHYLSTRTIDGQPLRLPGARGRRLRDERLASGIPLDRAVWNGVLRVAEERAIAVNPQVYVPTGGELP